MTMKLRPVQFVIRPVVVADDGENLTPVQTPDITIAASELAGFPDLFTRQLLEQQEHLNTEPATA